jgi:hypothetical protein
MSVITTRSGDYQGFGARGRPNEKHCLVCARKLSPPFLAWDDSGGGIFLCGDCCVRWRDGLIADLIECAASTELQRLGRLRGHVLVRTTTRELEEQATERKKLEDEAFAKFRRVSIVR